MFIVSLTSGNYAFSVFSGALKHTLNLSQTDLDTIAVYPYLAGLLTWTAGIVNDRCGSRTAVTLGASVQAITLVGYWFVATRRVMWPPLISLVVINFVTTLGNGAITAGVFCSINANFPNERGLAVGIAKAWVGLSGGILTQLYVGFVGKPDNSRGTLNFVLLMAGLAFFAAAVPARLVVLHEQLPKAERALRAKFTFCFGVVFSMAALVTVSALVGDDLEQAHRRYFAVAIVVVLLSLIVVPLRWPAACSEGCCAGDDGGRKTISEWEQEETKPLLLAAPKPLSGWPPGGDELPPLVGS